MKSKLNTVIALVYESNDIVGFIIDPAIRRVNIFNEDTFLGLERNHDTYLYEDAVNYVKAGKFSELTVTVDGKILPNVKDPVTWKTMIPAVDVTHLKMAEETRYAVVGIPTSYNHIGRLNMLLYGKNVQPYFEMLTSMKRVSKRHSSYKGFDMAIIRNIKPKYMTPELVTGKYKLLVKTSFFEAQLQRHWYSRLWGTNVDMSGSAKDAPATAKQTETIKRQLDAITAVNMNALSTVSSSSVAETFTGKYGPKTQKYLKRFGFKETEVQKEIDRLMTVLEAKTLDQIEERIDDLM